MLEREGIWLLAAAQVWQPEGSSAGVLRVQAIPALWTRKSRVCFILVAVRENAEGGGPGASGHRRGPAQPRLLPLHGEPGFEAQGKPS